MKAAGSISLDSTLKICLHSDLVTKHRGGFDAAHSLERHFLLQGFGERHLDKAQLVPPNCAQWTISAERTGGQRILLGLILSLMQCLLRNHLISSEC